MRKEKARTPVGIAADEDETDEVERTKRSMTVGKDSDAKTMTNATHKPNR
jgi:hypothetical protein